jgi:Arc/MetJ-type ribon-helix-helix transcriptional regulator
MLTIQLPEDLENCLRAEVESGRFASVDDVIALALRRLLKPPPPKKLLTQEELDRYMLEVGMISEIPDTGADADEPEEELIEIEGEPLSETIIRERR